VIFSAFQRQDADTGVTSFTLGNWADSLPGAHLKVLQHSIQLAAVTAIVSAVLGLALA
jgi:ABC-type spermidine/putrescine transport system permease subunit I